MTGDDFPASRFTLVGLADANASEMMLSPGKNIQVTAERRVDVRNYFGGLGKAAAGPQAYLTGVPAGGTVGAHFHDVSQFQIFLPNADGWFGRQPLHKYLVHYADAYTTYGPFGTRGEYLTFWTLRPRPATTTAFMPESRRKLQASPRRRRHVPVDPSAEGTADSAVWVRRLIPQETDGLDAFIMGARDGRSFTGPSSANSGGQYYLVLSGGVVCGDREYGPMSLGWLPPGEAGPCLVASSDGRTDVLVVQFPVTASSA